MAPAASLWADTAEPLPAFPKLAGEVKADVVIIGAGYTGLSAAHHIAKSGLSPVVLEANHPGWGASGRNGGVITAKVPALVPRHRCRPWPRHGQAHVRDRA
jgi:succinate dehydrogenase/fumarate reductase flavoprotein subunit